MNIKELEERSGLPRANIRYYEKEGLISPSGKANGCKDYNEEDLKNLKQIQLLRKHDVSKDQIKVLLNSPEAFSEFIDQYTKLIEQGSTEANDRYLQVDLEKKYPHPIIRYVARMVDLLMYKALILLAWNVAFHQISGSSTVEFYILHIISLLLMLFLEPLCISMFRTTPGKWMFGITLQNVSGEKLSYRDGFVRTSKLILWGMGWGIPIFELYRFFKSYRLCEKNQSLEWDYAYVMEYDIPEKSIVLPTIYVVVSFILFVVIKVGVSMYEMTPPNTGNLTLNEYIENYNYYVRYVAIKSGTLFPSSEGVMLDQSGQIIPLDKSVIVMNGVPDVHYQYTYDGEYVNKVSFEEHVTVSTFFDGYHSEMLYSTLAFASANEGFHLWNSHMYSLFKEVDKKLLVCEAYEAELNGVNATCNVDYDKSKVILETGFGGIWVMDEDSVKFNIRFALEK